MNEVETRIAQQIGQLVMQLAALQVENEGLKAQLAEAAKDKPDG